jgi:phospholipid/cholesterol/gamma-HCH transport system substrate-binding protein
METKARYALIGLFALGVIASGFAFVYWLQTTGGIGARAVYRVRFESPVSGLLVGSAVLFNGMRVGEVTSLGLNPQTPKEITAAVAIDPTTPVRSDTHVGIDFQGLTGAPVILLTGGSPSAPLLAGSNGEPPVLTADPAAGQSLSQAARETLRRFDAILSDNSAPLHDVITNLGTFSQALGRNSDRVDGIVAGLERMTGGAAGKAKIPIYELASASPPRCPAVAQGQLVIPEPTALLAFNTDKILVAGADGGAPPLDNAQWADTIPVLVHAKLIQSFENSGCFRSVNRPLEGLEVDYQLLTEIRRFRFSTSPGPQAEIEIAARILVGNGQIAATRVFHELVSATASDAPAVVAALNEAFAKVVTALELWTAETAANRTEHKRLVP